MKSRFRTYLSLVIMFALLWGAIQFPVSVHAEELNAAGQLADGEYTINFNVLSDQTDKNSVMDDYTVKPAKLTVKDNEYYVSLTLKKTAVGFSFCV